MLEKLGSFFAKKVSDLAQEFLAHADLNEDGKADLEQWKAIGGKLVAGAQKAYASVNIDAAVAGVELIIKTVQEVIATVDQAAFKAGCSEVMAALKEGWALALASTKGLEAKKS